MPPCRNSENHETWITTTDNGKPIRGCDYPDDEPVFEGYGTEPEDVTAEDREGWITAILRDGTTIRYWGDPDDPDALDDFDWPREPEDEAPDGEGQQAGQARDEAGPEQPSTATTDRTGCSTPRGLAVCMADVEPQEVEWLWHPYIPKGKLTSIEGDPGVGKSWLTCALAAQVSQGRKLPGMNYAADPAPVLLLTAEDGPADTIRPRLDAVGANVSKVHVISGLLTLDEDGADTLKDEIQRLHPALVIIDPIVAYLPGKTDMNKASDIRPVLARLSRVADETGAAIAFVRHLAKGTREKAIYRGLGSIDFTAACRSVLMVGFDPNVPGKRVVAHGKSNLAACGPSQAYTLNGSRFAWAGRSSLSAEDLSAPPPDADQMSAREEAREFLLETLAEGPKPKRDLQAEASKHGISDASLRRAKKDLGVKANKTPDHWEWSLPRPQSAEAGDQDAHPPGG